MIIIKNYYYSEYFKYCFMGFKYFDNLFPDAPKFREFMETEEDWSDTDITKVTTLINSYRRKHYNA